MNLQDQQLKRVMVDAVRNWNKAIGHQIDNLFRKNEMEIYHYKEELRMLKKEKENASL